jgi:hypothetical protein
MTRLTPFAVGLLAATVVAAEPPQPKVGSLKVGDSAPSVAADLLGQSKSVKLADLRGKPTVLVFGSCT